MIVESIFVFSQAFMTVTIFWIVLVEARHAYRAIRDDTGVRVSPGAPAPATVVERIDTSDPGYRS